MPQAMSAVASMRRRHRNRRAPQAQRSLAPRFSVGQRSPKNSPSPVGTTRSELRSKHPRENRIHIAQLARHIEGLLPLLPSEQR